MRPGKGSGLVNPRPEQPPERKSSRSEALERHEAGRSNGKGIDGGHSEGELDSIRPADGPSRPVRVQSEKTELRGVPPRNALSLIGAVQLARIFHQRSWRTAGDARVYKACDQGQRSHT